MTSAAGALNIRPARESDIDAIYAIESSEFANDAWSRQLVADEVTGEHRSYFALTDAADTVLGYAGILVVGPEADVQTIAVAPAARGAGHGRALMNTLIAAARSAGAVEMYLEVRADNPVARSLYASLDFVEVGVRPRYYQPDGVDAIVMNAKLKDLS